MSGQDGCSVLHGGGGGNLSPVSVPGSHEARARERAPASGANGPSVRRGLCESVPGGPSPVQGARPEPLHGPQALSFSSVGGEEAQLADRRIERVRMRSGDPVRVASRLLDKGASVRLVPGGRYVCHDVAKTCERPIVLRCEGYRPGGLLRVDLVTRCRKCEPCMRRRRREWVARALREMKHADEQGRRTWFVTLTLHPDQRYRLDALFHVKLSPWEATTTADRSRRSWLARWVDLYLKRVRNSAGAEFRYLAALERHHDGEYHVHLLVHEHLGKVTERDLRNAWKPAGFAQAKLVTESPGNVALYMAMYMTKEGGFPRQKASLRYGHGGGQMRPKAIDPPNYTHGGVVKKCEGPPL